jgi:hypothetical protein
MASVVSLATVALAGADSAKNPTRPGTAAQVKALVAASVTITQLSSSQKRELSKAGSDDAGRIYRIGNCQKSGAVDCVFGDTTSPHLIVLFGDSHATMWLPSIIPIATTMRLKIVLLSLDGCPVATLKVNDSNNGNCTAFRSAAIKEINHLKPVAVIMSQRTTDYSNYTSSQWQAGLTTTLKDLAPSKARFAVIGDDQPFGPANSPSVLQCLAAYPTNVQKCAQANPNKQQPVLNGAERNAIVGAGGRYIDPTPWLCTKSTCSPIIGGFIPYWDSYHVSVTYAQYLSSVVGAALKPIL